MRRRQKEFDMITDNPAEIQIYSLTVRVELNRHNKAASARYTCINLHKFAMITDN
jgi:hypothetical protein